MALPTSSSSADTTMTFGDGDAIAAPALGESTGCADTDAVTSSDDAVEMVAVTKAPARTRSGLSVLREDGNSKMSQVSRLRSTSRQSSERTSKRSNTPSTPRRRRGTSPRISPRSSPDAGRPETSPRRGYGGPLLGTGLPSSEPPAGGRSGLDSGPPVESANPLAERIREEGERRKMEEVIAMLRLKIEEMQQEDYGASLRIEQLERERDQNAQLAAHIHQRHEATLAEREQVVGATIATLEQHAADNHHQATVTQEQLMHQQREMARYMVNVEEAAHGEGNTIAREYQRLTEELNIRAHENLRRRADLQQAEIIVAQMEDQLRTSEFAREASEKQKSEMREYAHHESVALQDERDQTRLLNVNIHSVIVQYHEEEERAAALRQAVHEMEQRLESQHASLPSIHEELQRVRAECQSHEDVNRRLTSELDAARQVQTYNRPTSAGTSEWDNVSSVPRVGVHNSRPQSVQSRSGITQAYSSPEEVDRDVPMSSTTESRFKTWVQNTIPGVGSASPAHSQGGDASKEGSGPPALPTRPSLFGGPPIPVTESRPTSTRTSLFGGPPVLVPGVPSVPNLVPGRMFTTGLLDLPPGLATRPHTSQLLADPPTASTSYQCVRQPSRSRHTGEVTPGMASEIPPNAPNHPQDPRANASTTVQQEALQRQMDELREEMSRMRDTEARLRRERDQWRIIAEEQEQENEGSKFHRGGLAVLGMSGLEGIWPVKYLRSVAAALMLARCFFEGRLMLL